MSSGPRRSATFDAFFRPSRLFAAIALLLLAGGIASDAAEGAFWANHALLSGLVASLLVVALSAAVLNEVLERRRRGRWRVLAQYIMLELVRSARMFWTGVLEHGGVVTEQVQPSSIDVTRPLARDAPRVAAALRALVADPSRLHNMHEEISALATHAEDVLGRWAAVMLSADEYAEIIDRHVELAGDIVWLNDQLDNADALEPSDVHRRARSSPSVQVAGASAISELPDRIAVMTRLAEELDRVTLEIALRLVPVEWWATRLGHSSEADPTERGVGTGEPGGTARQR